MIRIKIYCSIRKKDNSDLTIQLFSDLECAKVDQELQEHYKNLGKYFLYSFTMVVDKATVWMDEVHTKEDYLKELQKKLDDSPNNLDIKEAIRKVQAL